MKITLRKENRLSFSVSEWRLDFMVPKEDGIILEIVKNDPNLRVLLENRYVEVLLRFTFKEVPLILSASVQPGDSVTVSNVGYNVSLYVNEKLMDEDWPVGEIDFNGSLVKESVAGVTLSDEPLIQSAVKRDVLRSFEMKNGWMPEGLNVRVGDCMPFCCQDTFHLFFLLDRRGHKSKWGIGAHQWAHISTKNFKTWFEHPLAVSIDHQQEGSICTGSVFEDQGKYYAFYAIRSIDGSPAKLSWSTSQDGIHFKKSGKFFTLSAPYDGSSARDPMVFAADGVFHMLLTTSIFQEGERRGCLSHLISDDLENWSPVEPILIRPDSADDGSRRSPEPECPDYFFRKGFYYLLAGENGISRYQFSRKPYTDFITPENPVVGEDTLFVPKSALWKDRLIFAGFKKIDERYGGRLYFYEAFQREDGSLRFEEMPEMK